MKHSCSVLPLVMLAVQAVPSDTLVRRIGAPRHPGVAGVVEEISIGVADGPASYAFIHITDVAAARDGSVLVLDVNPRGGGTPTLRLYDAAGRFVRNVGREGGGPGEFRMPCCIAALPNGRYALYDRGNLRLTLYSSSGDVLQTLPVPHYGASGARSLHGNADGSLALRFTRSYEERPRQEAIVRLAVNGAVIDTLVPPALPNIRQTVARSVRRGNSIQHGELAVPYTPQSLWEWSPAGFFLSVRTDRYALDIHGGNPVDGRASSRRQQPRVVTSVRASNAQVPVSARERDEQRAYAQRQLQGLAGDPVPEVPAVKPFFKFMYTGDDGRLWMSVHVPSHVETVGRSSGRSPGELRWHEPPTFDVFEPDGSYIGRVQFPLGVNFKRFSGDVVWAVITDDLDVPYLKRYRVRWAGRY